MKRNNKRKKGLETANIIIWIIMIVIVLLFVSFLIPFAMMLIGDAERLIWYLSDIYPFFDYAMTGFDADTQNHTVLREIVILTDGGGLDSSEYSAALALARTNDVVVSVLAYGASYPPNKPAPC